MLVLVGFFDVYVIAPRQGWSEGPVTVVVSFPVLGEGVIDCAEIVSLPGNLETSCEVASIREV